MYLFVKILHIVFACVAIGVNVSYGLWFRLAKDEPSQYGFALRGIKMLDDYVANPCYVGLGVTGPLMVFLGNWSWGTTWIWASMALYAALTVLGLLVYSPMLRRQIEILDEKTPEDPEFQSLNRRGQALGGAMGLAVLGIVCMMVLKPA